MRYSDSGLEQDALRYRKLMEVMDCDPTSGVKLPKMGHPNEEHMTLTEWLDAEIARDHA